MVHASVPPPILVAFIALLAVGVDGCTAVHASECRCASGDCGFQRYRCVAHASQLTCGVACIPRRG